VGAVKDGTLAPTKLVFEGGEGFNAHLPKKKLGPLESMHACLLISSHWLPRIFMPTCHF